MHFTKNNVKVILAFLNFARVHVNEKLEGEGQGRKHRGLRGRAGLWVGPVTHE